MARKLAEWIILRSDYNGATVERYRAFIVANPSWPSQTFLRRRAEAALWDDKRDDSTVLGWFENEPPLSGQGQAGAGARARWRAAIAAPPSAGPRGLAQRFDVGRRPKTAALEMFGALITPGDHKARMDALLYGSDTERGAARRQAARRRRRSRSRKARIARQQEGRQRQGAARRGAERAA